MPKATDWAKVAAALGKIEAALTEVVANMAATEPQFPQATQALTSIAVLARGAEQKVVPPP